jgi:outer membrane protein OmpA-like peptidoglycan-associated protein
MTSTSRLVRTSTVATLLGLGSIAHAQEAAYDSTPTPLAPGLQLSVKLEPGLAAALTDPQEDDTELGQGHNLQLLFGVNRWLAVGPSFTFTHLPADEGMTTSGRAYTFGVGGRLMRPHDVAGMALSPWVDASALFVHAANQDRPGFAVGTGIALPLDSMRRYWVGPFARYSQILQSGTNFENRDPKILTFGFGLEVTTGLARKRFTPLSAAADPIEPIVPPITDRDGDGILDINDLCPDVVGIVTNDGCPNYEKVVIKREKLEVQEKIAFLWDSAKLEESSYPALDEVVRALQDNRGFKVQIDGHASSEGTDAHNQTLSEQRANTVLDYLAAQGVARDRLISKGFSSSVPVETNTTAEGRDANRRVEFVVSFIIID